MNIDTNSETWIIASSAIKGLVERCRVELENPHQSEKDSALLRGRIEAYRTVLAFAEPKTVETVKPAPSYLSV